MEQVNNTFWGVVLQPGKRYEQMVEKSFHISMAVLDIANSRAGSQTQVMITVDSNEFILCHLSKKAPQQTLDLNFQGGDSLVLHVDGEAPRPVHLTGFYNEMDDDDSDIEQMTMDGLSDEEDIPKLVPAKLNAIKRKKESPAKDAAKKAKLVASVDEDEEDSDEDDNDSDGADVEDEEEEENEEWEEGFSDDDDDGEESDNENEGDEDEEGEDDDESEDSDDQEEAAPEIPLKKAKTKPDKQIEPEMNGLGSGDASGKKKTKDAKATSPKQEKKTAPDTPKTPKTIAKKTISGGVMIEDLTVGTGAVAKRGRPVSVYYVGRLKQNNKQFDATVGGPGLKFKLGGKEVIRGWDVGVEGMKIGGKRRITCPPHMAYGARGSPPVIPPNSTLVFDVTLKKVH